MNRTDILSRSNTFRTGRHDRSYDQFQQSTNVLPRSGSTQTTSMSSVHAATTKQTENLPKERWNDAHFLLRIVHAYTETHEIHKSHSCMNTSKSNEQKQLAFRPDSQHSGSGMSTRRWKNWSHTRSFLRSCWVICPLFTQVSPGFPEWYQADQACTISIDGEWTGSIHIDAFETESHFDILTVNGVDYSGDLSHVQMEGLEGMVPVGNIMWTSDYWTSGLGWRICRLPPVTSSPWSAEKWSCTLDGSPCLPFANTRSGAYPACTQMYSDLHDADGNGNIHNGHPWCDTYDQFSTMCGPCSCGAGEQQSYQMLKLFNRTDTLLYIECSACPAGRFKEVGGSGASDECSPCTSGKFQEGTGATACEACDKGSHASSEGSSTCSLCTPCKFGDELGDLVCNSCSAGSSSTSGSTACVACAPGRYSSETAPQCLSCSPGSFGSREGQTSCEECETGHFSISESQTACASCYEVLNPGGPNRDLWVTMERVQWKGQLEWANMLGAREVTSCGCAEGAWLSLASECFECGEGWFAEVWVSSSSRCHGDDWGRCPGGMPGSCARHRQNTSIACGECEPDTKNTTAGPCETCTGTDLGLLVAAVVVLLGGLSCVYCAIATENRARQRDDVALVGIMCGQMLTVFQVFGLWNLLSVQWPQPFATMVKFAAALNFRLEFLNVGCLGSLAPLAQFTFTAFAFFFLASFMVTLHLLRWLVQRIARVRPRFAHWKPSLVGALGTILMTLFIAVSSAILAPLRCDAHPNGRRTVQSYQQVVCWEADSGLEHRNMVVMASFASLILVSFISLCMWVVVSAPSRIRQGDTAFLHTFAFLLVVMLRNFAVALVPSISVGSLQLLVLDVVLVCYVITSVTVLPWAVYPANSIDVGTNMGFLLVTFLAALATNASEEETVAILLFVIFAVIVSFLFIGTAYSLLRAAEKHIPVLPLSSQGR